MVGKLELKRLAFNLRLSITNVPRAPKAWQGIGDPSLRRGALIDEGWPAVKNESDLDLAFASKIEEFPEFRSWVLRRTKFRGYSSCIRLLHEEQGLNRAAWWKHWWCKIPELGEERETDIFLVFEIIDSTKRFALHVENKKGNGIFSKGQAEGYAPKARCMMNKEKYLSYSDFETVLISPSTFRENNRGKCDLFDVFISYEDIAKFIPDFRD